MGDTPHLAIQFLWEDSNLEQLRISADNGRYSGTAKVYFSQGELRDFLHSIRGFPKHVAQTELFAGGSEETFPFARLEFHCTDGAGHSAVDVALGETVVQTISQYAPNLPGLILHHQVITPKDMEETYGLTGGHIFHGELALDQFFTMRPLLDWARYQTPIEHLFLCGNGTHPGTGLTGGSGANAAKEIIKKLRK